MDRPDDYHEGIDPEARYASFLNVGYNSVEFVFDLGQVSPSSNVARVHTRIVTTPSYAAAMLRTLAASMEEYERHFGPVSKGAEPPKEEEPPPSSN